MTSTDRDRGIFSSSDRAYLQNPEQWENEHSHSAVEQRKEAISTRIQNSIIDFHYISNENFSWDMVDSTFRAKKDIDPKERIPRPLWQAGQNRSYNYDIQDGFVSAISTLYRAYPLMTANRIIREGVIEFIEKFKPELEVKNAKFRPQLTHKKGAHDRAKEALSEGSSITNAQLRLLLLNGEVEPAEVATHVRRNFGGEPAHERRRERLKNMGVDDPDE
jgi:hypothetical protein